MYTFKRMTSFILALLMLNLAVSCQKEEVNRTVSGSTESEIDKPISPWLLYLAAAVIVKVVVELSEGQYDGGRTIYYENGRVKEIIRPSCNGIGICTAVGVINNEDGTGDGQPLSLIDDDQYIDDSIEFESINAQVIKLDDGRVIYTIDPNEFGYEAFFYASTISISKSYTINNPVVFELLDMEDVSSIVLSGEYEVLSDDNDNKYIVIY